MKKSRYSEEKMVSILRETQGGMKVKDPCARHHIGEHPLDATLKHLVALRGAGLVVTAENPQDGRRLLYHLAPAIPATKTERGWEMDFGYCLVRG
ncbi:MAG: hypothetical protein HS117_15535 [Verrucomicrobiaceae bacterium]|nr:hypothetical protein [Verrucomicrobiaceae bacterium]